MTNYVRRIFDRAMAGERSATVGSRRSWRFCFAFLIPEDRSRASASVGWRFPVLSGSNVGNYLSVSAAVDAGSAQAMAGQ